MEEAGLLAGCYDGYIHGIALENFREMITFSATRPPINRIVVLDNKMYVCMSRGFQVFDLQRMTTNGRFVEVSSLNITDICINSTTIFTCSEAKEIKSVDRRTGKDMLMFSAASSQMAMCLLRNGYNLISAGENGDVTLWDVRNLTSVYKVSPNKTPCMSVSLHPNENAFVASYQDGFTYNYKIEADKFDEQYNLQAHDDIILRCVYSPNGSMFATTSGDNSVKLWSADKGELLHTLKTDEEDEWIWDCSFTHDPKYLFTGSSGGLCGIWEIDPSPVLLETLQLPQCVSAIALF